MKKIIIYLTKVLFINRFCDSDINEFDYNFKWEGTEVMEDMGMGMEDILADMVMLDISVIIMGLEIILLDITIITLGEGEEEDQAQPLFKH
jgi:hypothetical protein